MATKKAAAADTDTAALETIQLQRLLAIEVFVDNARSIAENEKTERLVKMAHDCPKLKSPTPTNKELWKIVQKVRREVLGRTTRPARKTASRKKESK